MALILIGVAFAIALVWGGIRTFSSNRAPSAPLVAEPAQETPPVNAAVEQSPNTQTSPPAAARSQPGPAKSTPAAKAKSAPAETEISSAGVNEVIPDVPDRARRTIRGHVRVSIRVIVEPDGTVFAALTEQRGPSRYFERLAIDAAKKWTFPPTDADAQRFMLVKFAFSRQGTTAQAVPLK
jgi:TonB family protein